MYGEVRQNSIGISVQSGRVSVVEAWHWFKGRLFPALAVEKRPDQTYACYIVDPEYGRHCVEGSSLEAVIGFMEPDPFGERLKLAFAPGIRLTTVEDFFPGFVFVDVE